MKKDTVYLGYSLKEYKKFKKYAWLYLIMFSLLYCFLYCTRLNIGSATPYLVEYGWSESTIGILTGTLFWTYGIGQLINGRLSELFGPAKFVILAVVLSAGANLLVATQRFDSIVILAIIWGFNGYFQSMGWTPGLAALTKWWPANRRGFAIGFVNAFSGFGQVVAYFVVLIAYKYFSDFGWRVGFVVPAMVPLMFLCIYLVIVKTSPAQIGLKEYVEIDEDKAETERKMGEIVQSKGSLYPYKYVLSNKKFIVWMIIAFSTGLVRYGLSTWIPLFFKQQGMTSASSIASSIILPVGMGIGTLVVPWLTDRFCPRDRLPAAILSSIVGAVATVVIFWLDATNISQLIIVEILLFVAGFCIYAVNGIAFAYATDVGGRVFSGTCSGILNFFAYIGAAIQSVVYGFILNHGGWNIVFYSITLFFFLIAMLGIVGAKKKEY